MHLWRGTTVGADRRAVRRLCDVGDDVLRRQVVDARLKSDVPILSRRDVAKTKDDVVVRAVEGAGVDVEGVGYRGALDAHRAGHIRRSGRDHVGDDEGCRRPRAHRGVCNRVCHDIADRRRRLIDRLPEIDTDARGANRRRVDNEIGRGWIEGAGDTNVDAVGASAKRSSRNVLLHENRRRGAHRERDRRRQQLIAGRQRAAVVGVAVDASHPSGSRRRAHRQAIRCVTNVCNRMRERHRR